MSSIRNLHNSDTMHAEASMWIARLDRGLSTSEKQELETWMAKSTRNRDTILSMAKVWDRMDALNRLSDIFPHRSAENSRFKWRNLALAASFLIVVSIGLLGVLKPLHLPTQLAATNAGTTIQSQDTFETSIGEHSTINLQDGTKVTLNTNSLVVVQYTNDERLIHLQRGELHIQVHHDKDRPLKVMAGRSVVRAVGTAFAINMNDQNRIELLVTDGTVEVSYQEPVSRNSFTTQLEQINPVSVRKGDAMVLDSSQSEVSHLDSEEIAVRLAWRQGNLIFRGEPLSEAVKEVSRYASVSFVFDDEASKNRRVAGRFKVGDIDGLLAALQENFQISSERVGEDTIVLREGRL